MDVYISLKAFDHSIDLFSGLSTLGNTLTTLNISLHDPALSLASVMTACPNLRCLEFNSPFWYGSYGDDLDVYPTAKLRALKLDNYSTRPLLRHELIWVLSRLGSGLRVLNVPVCDRDLDVVELCCPQLHTLTCGAYLIVPAHDTTEESLSLDDIEADNNNNNNGLRHLTMAPQDLRLFLGLMKKHSDTLETMQLWLNTPLYGGDIFSESGRIIRHLQLNRLNSLSIVTVPGFRMDRFLEMMRGMCRPSLHKLYLQGDRSIPSPSLPDMPHLKCLRLCQLDETIEHHMTSYFTRLAAMGDACPMTTIEIYDVAFTDQTFSLLAKIQTLRCIKIVSGPRDSWSENGIIDFFVNTQSSIQTVGLSLPQITDKLLDAVGDLPFVKRLLLVQKLPLERITRFKSTYPAIQVIKLDKREYHLCCCTI